MNEASEPMPASRDNTGYNRKYGRKKLKPSENFSGGFVTLFNL